MLLLTSFLLLMIGLHEVDAGGSCFIVEALAWVNAAISIALNL
jgi:hypothetical protein